MIISEGSRKAIINCDWLAFSVRLFQNLKESELDFNIPAGCRLELFEGTNIYNHRALLYSPLGDKIFTILWLPKSKVIPIQSAFVQIANQWLYSDIEGASRLVFSVVRCVFSNMSRVDICIDFVPSEYQWEVIESLGNGSMYVAQKEQASGFYIYRNGHRVPKDMNFGSFQSQQKWKLYNKSLELKEKEDKPYIRSQWAEVWDVKCEIWRLEVSLSELGKQLVDGAKIELSDVLSTAWLLEVFRRRYRMSFIVRKDQGHSRRCNDEAVVFLEIGVSSVDMRREGPKGMKATAEGVRQFNAALKGMLSTASLCSIEVFSMWEHVASGIVELFDLDSYIRYLYGDDWESLVECMSNLVGSGVVSAKMEPARGLKAIKPPFGPRAETIEGEFDKKVEEIRKMWNL